MSVVTNIDKDHLENYHGDFERLKQTYIDFIHQAPFYENIFLCIDDKILKSIIPKDFETYSDLWNIKRCTNKSNRYNS